MSGAFGWGGKDRAADHKNNGTTGFGSAYDAYQQPSPGAAPTRGSVGAVIARPGASPDSTPDIQAIATLTDLTAKDLVADADNVLIVNMDVTGSMGAGVTRSSLACRFCSRRPRRFSGRVWSSSSSPSAT